MTTRPGLRERKKAKTRRLLRQEALRLFVTQGYDHTTVEQICDAADVSPSTFFRYFPAKEDVVLMDDPGPSPDEPGAACAAGPGFSGEPPADDAVRATLRDLLARRVGPDPDTTLARLRLAARVRPLRARLWQHQEAQVAHTAALLARRAGRDADAYEVRLGAAVLVAVTTETLLYWAERDGEPDLTTLFAWALDRLGGLRL
ncbi:MULTISPECIES: TetR family transcriptional regulator [Streptomyces]|uniref:TetR family transcriptional regulator n=1 Tax=Streptomyces eurythermus TaxID=42237 RepID=A0ABW6YRD0_9ACTN|nr:MULTISPECIES: TetR family transcriptional regulator [Streptomyces]QIS72086.1 TetR family transcriptional regulator [Streptomyces sp. DSM 40868]